MVRYVSGVFRGTGRACGTQDGATYLYGRPGEYRSRAALAQIAERAFGGGCAFLATSDASRLGVFWWARLTGRRRGFDDRVDLDGHQTLGVNVRSRQSRGTEPDGSASSWPKSTELEERMTGGPGCIGEIRSFSGVVNKR